MKKIVLLLLCLGAISYFFFSKNGKVVKNVVTSYVIDPILVHEEGLTVSERIVAPEGYKRVNYVDGTFQKYLQTYPLKNFDAKVVNYDGTLYGYQRGHVGVLEVPVPSNGLQQCADALMRLRAEYLWQEGRKTEIGFNFTSGHYCSWSKYALGYRPKVKGNKVTFHQTASRDSSKENFYNYLNLIYMYAGTQSLFDELPKVSIIEDVRVGDMLIYPGSPGHVIMIVDQVENERGEKLFIFAQGNTPAQSVHILKNPNNSKLSPWYNIEMGQYLEIPTYYFNEVKFVRFK
ncbi:MAG: DUF4846 domain-containing protein [Bacteroidetes bacterium]|nr:DUF4846 domain-containing protein [Bacteroidota bacterium]